MQQITWTEFKKLTVEDVRQMIPIEIMYNSEPIFRVVPKTWKDPRFLMVMGEEIGRKNAEKR